MQRFVASVFICVSVFAHAQHSLPDTVSAYYSTDEIIFDGVLSEPVWNSAIRINNFTQRDLNFGEPCTERTEVAIVYTQFALYVGVWVYQSDPKTVIAKFLQRDFDYDSDENFKIIISPFNDQRNGYEFVINPLGARADLLVSGNENSNIDWNGVWDAKTTINDEGWFAEIVT